jgi:hypothetical protein
MDHAQLQVSSCFGGVLAAAVECHYTASSTRIQGTYTSVTPSVLHHVLALLMASHASTDGISSNGQPLTIIRLSSPSSIENQQRGWWYRHHPRKSLVGATRARISLWQLWQHHGLPTHPNPAIGRAVPTIRIVQHPTDSDAIAFETLDMGMLDVGLG